MQHARWLKSKDQLFLAGLAADGKYAYLMTFHFWLFRQVRVHRRMRGGTVRRNVWSYRTEGGKVWGSFSGRMWKKNIIDWLPGKSLSLSVPPRLLTGGNAPRYRSPTNHGERIPKLVTGVRAWSFWWGSWRTVGDSDMFRKGSCMSLRRDPYKYMWSSQYRRGPA